MNRAATPARMASAPTVLEITHVHSVRSAWSAVACTGLTRGCAPPQFGGGCQFGVTGNWGGSNGGGSNCDEAGIFTSGLTTGGLTETCPAAGAAATTAANSTNR